MPKADDKHYPSNYDLDYAYQRLKDRIDRQADWASVQVIVWEIRVVLEGLKKHKKIIEE